MNHLLFVLLMIFPLGTLICQHNPTLEIETSSKNGTQNTFTFPDSITLIDTTKQYALIAGGSKGIGFAIAEALARRGYNLILIA